MSGPDIAKHVELINWSYRGRIPATSNPNLPVPSGYVRVGTPIENRSGEVRIDVLRRVSDNTIVILPRGTTPDDKRSLSANLMLPDMSQVRGAVLERVLTEIRNTNGRVEIIGHSQGASHGYSIGNAAVAENPDLKSRMTILGYNPAPMGAYDSGVEARIGSITTSYRTVWAGAGMDRSGYRYGDLISMLGPVPGRMFEVLTQYTPAQKPGMEIHNPNTLPQDSSTWVMREVTRYNHNMSNIPIFRLVSSYASSWGDPSSQELEFEAVGRLLAGIGSGLIGRGEYQNSGIESLDDMLTSLVSNLKYSAQNDNVENAVEDTIFQGVLNYLSDNSDFNSDGSTATGLFLLFIGNRIVEANIPVEQAIGIVNDAKEFADEVVRKSREFGSSLQDIVVDFGFGMYDRASRDPIVTFFTNSEVAKFIFDPFDPMKFRPIGNLPFIPFFQSGYNAGTLAVDYAISKVGNLLRGVFGSDSNRLLFTWDTYTFGVNNNIRIVVPENYILKSNKISDTKTEVWFDDKGTTGDDFISFWVSEREFVGGGALNPYIFRKEADKVVVTIPPSPADPQSGRPAVPARTIIVRTSDPDASLAGLQAVMGGTTTNPVATMSDEEIAVLLNAHSVTVMKGKADGRHVVPTLEEVEAELLEAEKKQTVAEFKWHNIRSLHNVDTSNLFSAFGSVLGSRLGGDDPLKSAIGSAALETLLSNIGEALEALGAPGDQSGGTSIPSILGEQLASEFFASLRAEGVSAVSTWLISHVIDALDLEGTVAELGSSLGGSMITQIINNLSGSPIWADAAGNILKFGADGQVVASGGQVGSVTNTGLNPPTGAQQVSRPWNLNLSQAAGSAFASFLGSKLADQIKTFDSVYGQIGAAIGQAYGSMNAAAYLSLAGINPLTLAVAAIAVAVWKLIGGFVGSLFGASKSYATVEFNDRSDTFSVGAVSSRRGGSKEGAVSLASSVADVLNSVIDATGARVSGLVPMKQQFGMRNSEYVYWTEDFRSRDVGEVLKRGYYDGLAQLVPHLVGGDVFAKRALLGSLNLQTRTTFGIDSLLGDLTIARDFTRYLTSPIAIKTAIETEPTSAFAAGWVVTLARAQELGLDKRAFTDWLGGWASYTDMMADGKVDGVAWSAANLEMDFDPNLNERTFVFLDYRGKVVGVTGDTVDSAGKNDIEGTAGADVITVIGDTLQVAAGVTVRKDIDAEALAVTAPHKIRVAAVIDGGAGDDVIRGGDLGNDLLGGEGADVLVGGKLDDWLFGQEGDDVLFAGDVANTGFAIGDRAAEIVAIGSNSGNGDYLDGGDGNDRLYGGKGSDWLKGGAGVDRLVGGAGGDVLHGGAGDDKGAGGTAGLLGGAGADQYVFGFGDGADVILDDANPNAVEGSATADTVSTRIWAIEGGLQARNWAGGGDYQVDGSVRGGEDAISFGPGVSMAHLSLSRSGGDLVIALMNISEAGVATPSGDVLTVRDWFDTARRVEWLRFADGEELRIGDMTSFLVGTGASDVILGTNAADFLYGGAGNDELRGLRGNDFGNGGSGDDFVAGDADNDWVMGGSGQDQVIGGAGHDTVFGDGGDDRVFGGSGSDLVSGGRGNDYVVGGEGDDIFRFERGDGQDVLLDDLVDNWDVVWVNGVYQGGYAVQPNGTVTLDGVVFFDGARWVGGHYDWDDTTKTLRRHKGAVGGVIGRDSGTDSIEFGVGIDIQDLSFERTGADLKIAIGQDGDATNVAAATDSLTIKDWYSGSAPIENFVFAATGRHAVDGMTLTGGTAGADTLTGTGGKDWITANGGDDVIDGGAGDDILVGGAGSDHIKGGLGADVLFGGAGDDLLQGGGGADVIVGGDGTDIVSYADGFTPGEGVTISLDRSASQTGGDTLIGIEGLEGTAYADRLNGDTQDNVLRGGKGSDILMGSSGDDTYEFNRGDGSDVIVEGVVIYKDIVSTAGVLDPNYRVTWDEIDSPGFEPSPGPGPSGWSYRLTVTRIDTGDVVYQSRDYIDFRHMSQQSTPPPASQWPTADGQWGRGYIPVSPAGRVVVQDTVAGDGGVDTLQMGAGISLSDITFTRWGNDLRVILDGTDQIWIRYQGLADSMIEEIAFADGMVVDLKKLVFAGDIPTNGDDFMAGTAGDDYARAYDGNDVMWGGLGSDLLYGGAGDDTLEGGAGADTLDGESDSLTEEKAINGAAAYGDTIRYVGSSAGVSIDLHLSTASGGDAAGDIIVVSGDSGFSSIENVVGSQLGGDVLKGDQRKNRLAGLGGDDHLDGREGDDVLSGGDGHDTLIGSIGDDALAGDAGDDLLHGDEGADLISGGDGVDQIWGGADADRISGDAGSDTIYGGAGNDTIGGGDGADLIFGETGADTLSGGEGDDTLDAGEGADILSGGGGSDHLRGGHGADEYQFDSRSGTDEIIDSDGLNRISFSDIDKSRLWLSRSGEDLVLTVLGGDSRITLKGYYAASPTARAHKIVTSSGAFFLGTAEPLIQAMTAVGVTPATMPPAIANMLAAYWHVDGSSAPTVVQQNLQLAEDTTLSGTPGAVDHDSDIVSYEHTQPTLGTLQLNSLTGDWIYTPRANVSGKDSFTIKIKDAQGHSADQVVNIDVTPVNDAPSLVGGRMGVAEGAANGTFAGGVVGQDADGDAMSYTLLDDAGGRFTMGPDGRLHVANGAAIDFEATPTLSVVIRVTDSTGLSSEQAFIIRITNASERPNAPALLSQPTTVLQEGVPVGGVRVANYSATDPDGTVPTLVVNSGWFQVNGSAVDMANVTLDFESRVAAGATLLDTDGDGAMEAQYSLSVTATDGSLTSTATILTIGIEDTNEAPTDIVFTPAVASINERDRAWTGADMGAILLGTLASTDADLATSIFSQNHVFSVSDARFEVVNGNELRLKAGAALDFEAENSVTLAVTVTDMGGSGLSRTETVTFSIANLDDYLYGGATGETLVGQANRDIIAGNGGADTVNAGTGDDDVYGGDGDDTLNGQDGADRLWGDLGDDILNGGLGADVLRGGDGRDTLSGNEGADQLFGDGGDDVLSGGAGANQLDGGGGNDVLWGGDDADSLVGGAGDDALFGGAGADAINGGEGYDTLSFAHATAGVHVRLETGGVTGEAAGDTYAGIERVIGSAFDDRLEGTAGADRLEGGAGADVLIGGAGRDTLLGGAGADVLEAGDDGDDLDGGEGADVMNGGLGSDVFRIDRNSGADQIFNYDPTGTDIDVLGYRDINRNRLWFECVGSDLVVAVIGTDVRTTIKNWYTLPADERANFKIDFFVAGEHYSTAVNAEGLVALMAERGLPATEAAYDAMLAETAFRTRWDNYWLGNVEAVISAVGPQTVLEDGVRTISFTVTDDIQHEHVIVTAFASNGLVAAPVVSAPDASGQRTVTLTTAPNASGQVTITLMAEDQGGLVSRRSFTLDITPQADAPWITVANASGTTLDSGSLALNVQAALVDQDGSETLEIRISNLPSGLSLNQGIHLGNGVWSLTPAQLSGLALTGPATWSQDLTGSAALTVTAISRETATGHTAQTTTTLPVTINARPTDIVPSGAFSINESVAGGTDVNGAVVGSFTRIDADGDAATFSLRDNAGGRFAISTTGILTVANGALLDRESAASHSIVVRVTDSGGLTRDETFTITVNNVNEAPSTPTVISQPITLIGETASVSGAVVANLGSWDPDGTAPSFVIVSNPQSAFETVGSQLRFKAGQSVDFEGLRNAGYALTDVDGDGRLEANLTVTVRATDGQLNSGDIAILVRVEDVNEAPTDISPDGFSIAENSATGSVVGYLGASDPDQGEALSFSLLDSAGGRFALSAAGALTVANGALLDREAAASHTVTIRVTDSGGLVRDETVTIGVSNVNEAPTTPTIASQPLSIASENGAIAGQVVATLSAVDPDGTAPSYVEVSDPLGWFTLSGSTISVTSGLNFDFDSLAASGLALSDVDGDGQKEVVYSATYRATDGALNSQAQTVTLRIEDVNERPDTEARTFLVPESAPGAGQTLVGTMSLSDPDSQGYNRDNRFSISGADAALFSINPLTGQIYLQGSLSYEQDTQKTLQVTVRDANDSSLSETVDVTVNVGNVNEAPYVVGNIWDSHVYNYNSNHYGYVGSPMGSFVDPDGDVLTYTVTSYRSGGDEPDGGYYYYSDGEIFHYGPYTPSWGYGPRGQIDHLTITATDTSGMSVSIYMDVYFQYLGSYPVMFDFDGDGLDLLSPNASNVRFDHNNDGFADRTGWLSRDDGMLVLDRNGNGRIDGGAELSFIDDLPGARTDLEGLRAYDSNADGRFDASDAQFGRFQVWRDLNQDGVSQAEELSTLGAAGVAAISLDIERTGAQFDGMGNAVLGYADFIRSDGSVGRVGDVVLAYTPHGPAPARSTPTTAASGQDAGQGPGQGQEPYARPHRLPLLETVLFDDAVSGRTTIPRPLIEAGNLVPSVSTPTAPLSSVPRTAAQAATANAAAIPGPGGEPYARPHRRPLADVALSDKAAGGATAASGPSGPRDPGAGDAAPTRVDRSSNSGRSPAQIIRDLLAQREGSRPHLTPPMPDRFVQTPGEVERVERYANPGVEHGVEAKPLEALDGPSAADRTALHANLALAARKRFQMIEAMAQFSGKEDGAMDSNWRGMLERRTPPLLTALPEMGPR